MLAALRAALSGDVYTVNERFIVPAREVKRRHIPRFLFDSRVGLHVSHSFGGEIWNHQSLALEKLGEGRNVVVSTGTASGKSLIFRAAAFHRVVLARTERVIVFYPLKALAADQLRGWKEMARSLELPEEIVGRIDGSVDVKERDRILKTSRILIMTPDVFQAWLT